MHSFQIRFALNYMSRKLLNSNCSIFLFPQLPHPKVHVLFAFFPYSNKLTMTSQSRKLWNYRERMIKTRRKGEKIKNQIQSIIALQCNNTLLNNCINSSAYKLID